MNARREFDRQLEELSGQLIEMGALATAAIDRCMKAFETGDKAMMQQVIDGDNKVDQMERGIEQRCLTLLLTQQPVAGDLRRISTAIKMITDIERVGDHAADIAGISLYIDAPVPQLQQKVLEMARAAREMVAASIDAYVEENLELARRTIAKDDVVDDFFDEIKTMIARRIEQGGHHIDAMMDYLMIIKYVERIGDHAVNICEWVVYNVTGVHKSEELVEYERKNPGGRGR